MSENSPSKVAASEMPLMNFIAAEAVVRNDAQHSGQLRQGCERFCSIRQSVEPFRGRAGGDEAIIMRPGKAAARFGR
jgi:hypothetical protein